MPAYHSAYNEDADSRVIGSMSLLPFRSRIRGPAGTPGKLAHATGEATTNDDV